MRNHSAIQHNAHVPTSSQWLAFVIASALFIQLPGPSLLFTLGRALTVSLRAALTSVVGNAVGVVAQALLVAVGLGALVAASASAYTGLKVAGAAYIIWLGVQAIRHRGDARAALMAEQPMVEKPGRALLTGFVVGVTNPKTIVFFVAFLPQFTNTSAPAAPQLALLGLIFGAMAIVSDSVWAMVAGAARTWFARRPSRLDAVGATGGVMMIALGTAMVSTK